MDRLPISESGALISTEMKIYIWRPKARRAAQARKQSRDAKEPTLLERLEHPNPIFQLSSALLYYAPLLDWTS